MRVYNMIVYNYMNYKPNDKQAEFKRKRKLCDQVFDYCKKKGYECHPCDNVGLIIHFALDNKAGREFILVAESEDILPEIKEPHKFMKTEDFLKGKLNTML